MEHYGTLAEADAYHAARGRTAWEEAAEPARVAALVRGSDYIDQRYRFPGTRTGGQAQDRAWPRTGVTAPDGAIPAGEVPAEVERATYEAAFRELVTPGSLSPDYVPARQVVRQKVGPLERTFATAADTGGNPVRPVVSAIDEILAALLYRPSGIGVRVV